MWNFRKLFKGDTRYLYILDNYYDLPKSYPSYEKWDNIFWEYIEARGFDYNFKKRLDLKAKLVRLESEKIFDGKKNNVKIMMVNEKLKSLQKEVKENNDLENDMILSKFMGGNLINPKTTTVSQYIGIEKLLNSSNKEAKEQNNKHGKSSNRN